jgi:hypothetical protein
MMLQPQFNNRVALSSCNRPLPPFPLLGNGVAAQESPSALTNLNCLYSYRQDALITVARLARIGQVKLEGI